MKKLISIALCSSLSLLVTAQNTDISGSINSYTSVSAVLGNSITVASSSSFSNGDLALLVQMQGATIDESNSSAFGDITSIGDAGNYEFVNICSIPNETEVIVTSIQRSYSVSDAVQLIRVPVYNDATIIGPLTASSWDGSTGGILTFQCTGTLSMNASIDAKGKGFRGAAVTTSDYSCAWFFDVTDYFYNILTGEGAGKGEGVAQYISGKTGGRGAQSNGGGGSNDHNGGGGGGANAGGGGVGGERIRPSTFTCRCNAPGEGGKANVYSNADNKIFLGGGGGAGHENNPDTATPGSNGGGIVIIKVNELNGNGHSIDASGGAAPLSSGDGSGGGGGGGTVLLDVSSYIGPITVDVSGSDGGSVNNLGPSNCNGPGGGGGGGVLWINQASIPGNITFNNTGGANGTTLTTSQENCTPNGSNNAQPGSNGILETSLLLVENNCNIPLTQFQETICSADSLFLAGEWQTSSGVYYDTIEINCCDSIIETTLSVLPPLLGTLDQALCSGDSIVINGTTYNSTILGATEVFNNVGLYNCDSTVTINLTFNTVDVTVTNTSPSLTANAIGASYQWLDCEDNFAFIDGATSQEFTPVLNGMYAVEVTENNCSDTSACETINTIGIDEQYRFTEVYLKPNPTYDISTLVLGDLNGVSVRVLDTMGRVVFWEEEVSGSSLILDRLGPAGLYIVEISYRGQKHSMSLLKL